MRRASLINIFSVVIIGINRAAPVRVGERLFWRAVICTVPLLFGAHQPTSSRGSWPSIRAPAVRPVSDVSRDLRLWPGAPPLLIKMSSFNGITDDQQTGGTINEQRE